MKIINCFCEFKDQFFERTLEAMLGYSGRFNVIKKETNENIIDCFGDFPQTVLFSDEDECVKNELDSLQENDIDNSDDNISSLSLLKVSKYTPFSELLIEVNKLLGLNFEIPLNQQLGNMEDCFTIGVYSLAGRVGASTIAKAISRLLYRRGYKVLFMDLTPVTISASNLDGLKAETTELLYNIKRGRTVKLEEYADKESGVYCIRRSMVERNVNVFDLGMFNYLRKSAVASGFEAIVFDMGNHLYEHNISILKNMSKGVCVFPRTIKGEAESGLIQAVSSMGPQKTVNIVNNSWNDKEQDFYGRKSSEDLYDVEIPYVEDMSEKSLDSLFGSKVYILIDKLLEV